MDSITGMIYSLLAEMEVAGKTTEVTGMRWDGWFMLIFGVLLLYGGVGWCLWIAAGRGNRAVWDKEEGEEEDEEEPSIELMNE